MTSLQQGLVGHWTFDDADVEGTTARDVTPYGNDGTITGATTGVSGQIGEALDFDGTTDYVNLPELTAIGDTGTLTCWVKFDAVNTGTRQYLFASYGSGSGTILSLLEDSGLMQFGLGDRSRISSGLSVTTGTWYFFGLVWDSGSYTVYVDTDSNAGEYTGTVGSVDPFFGALNGSPTQLLDGTMDNVRIYNRALSASEVAYLAQMRSNRFAYL